MDSLSRIPREKIPASSQTNTLPQKTFSKASVPRETKQGRKLLRLFGLSTTALFLVTFLTITWIAFKTGTVSNKISVSSSNSSPSFFDSLRSLKNIATPFISETEAPLRTTDTGQIHILFLGRAGEHHPGKNLTDTVMIMNIDTYAKKVSLLSLPRDLFVPIPNTNISTKLNTLYQIGLDRNENVGVIRDAVSNITGLSIQYFVIVNFDAFQKIIDDLGGIRIEVERDIFDTRYPGPNYSYETFKLSKGWQTLDGATALKYVRERHNDPEGDFGRAKRQQKVMQAVKDQAFSLGTYTNPLTITKLLNTLGEGVQTDIAPEEIAPFLELSRSVDTRNITNVVVDAWKKESLLKVSHVLVGSTWMFVLIPRVGDWSEVHELATHLFDLDTLRRQKDEQKKEGPSVAIINQTTHPEYTNRLTYLLHDQLEFEITSLDTTLDISLSSDQNKSLIIDLTHGQKPWSLNNLIKTTHATLAPPLSSKINMPSTNNTSTKKTSPTSTGKQPDFVIIMNQDIETLFRYEEASPEDYQKNQDDPGYSDENLSPLPK